MAIDMAKFLARFVEEAREHINKLNEGLFTLEKTPDDSNEKRDRQGFGVHYGVTYFFFLGSSFLASSLTSIFVAFIT